jgi:GNAT superfamily N-acetyltransferase
VPFFFRYALNAYQALSTLKPDGVTVGAEHPGTTELIGLGMVSFGQCQFEGQVRRFALLDNLHIHPAFRRQGLAEYLTQWRIAQAQERIGREGVILAAIQQDNVGSLANAYKWCRQRVGQLTLGMFQPRTRPVTLPSAITIRAAHPSELDLIAQQLNTFYQGYNLYIPQTSETLGAWLAQPLGTTPFHHYVVAVSATGQLLAGLSLTEEYRVRTRQVPHLPTGIWLINKLLRLVPPDGELREVRIDKIWFASGGLEAARYLWETVRWRWGDRVTTLVVPFDPRGPVAAVYRIPLWMPRGSFTLAVSGPATMDDKKLIYPIL